MKIENNTETIAELAKILNDNKLDEITVESGDFSVTITAKCPPPPPFAPAMPGSMPPPRPEMPMAVQVNGDVKVDAKPETGNIVKSPIVGTFYSAAAPGKKPFVKVGDRVTKGSVICIVESMKLMNEITCEFDGTVAEIYVHDGDSVEFEQKLMRIE